MYDRTILAAGLAGALTFPWSSWIGAQEAVPQAEVIPQATDTEELQQQLQEAQGPVPLNRGPIHEAFAEPFALDPEPGLTVPKRPPEPIEEIPPDTRPNDENMVWFSGYWGWDAELEEFIWVSGAWRRPPPNHRWLPGYWNEVAEGWQWVPGTWVRAEQQELEYLPEPPESLESGPNSQAPSNQHFWVPGCWIWQQERYVWQPGYWSMGYDDWVWMPHRYIWTPYGCVFARGYWDYPFVRRGWLFAPHFFPFRQPGFSFSPFTPYAFIYPRHLFSSFWIWPGYHHYFFGNFFGLAGRHPGFFPWHQFHGSRRGYDPLFWHHGRMHPGGITAFHRFADGRFNRFDGNPHQRPPHTMRDLDRVRGQADRDVFDRGSFARPLEGIDRRTLGGSRRLDERQRREFAEAGGRMNEFAGRRRQLESRGARELADRDRSGRRPQNLGLPSTRATELRDARRSVPTQQARRADGRRQEARRPDWTRPEGRRPNAARPSVGRPSVGRPDGGRPAPGRGPAVSPRPGSRPSAPQLRGGARGGRPTPSLRGGGPRGGRPTPSLRGGGGGRPPARGGGGGRGRGGERGRGDGGRGR